MKLAKKIAKVFSLVLLSIVLLNIMLFFTFMIPSVQKYAADFAIKKLQPKLQTEVRLDRIRIKFFNSVEIGGLYVEDQKKDTLIYFDRLAANVRIGELLHNRLSVQSVELDNLTATVNRATPESPFNFQFIIDAFASTDTVKKPPSDNPLEISINNVNISNGTLRYDIQSAPYTPYEFNSNHLYVTDFNFKAKVPSLDMKKLKVTINNLSLNEHYAGMNLQMLRGTFRSKDDKYWTNKFKLKFNNSEINIRRASFDTKSQEYIAHVKSDGVDPQDIAIFTSTLSHLDKTVKLETEMRGQLPQVELQKFKFSYGDDTRININGSLSNYNDINNSDAELNVVELSSSADDIHDFIRIGPPDFEEISYITALNKISINLEAKGRTNNLKTKVNIITQPGTITFDGTSSIQDMFANMIFSGRVRTSNFHVAKVIGESIGVDNLYLDTYANVKLPDIEPMSISAKGDIKSVKYNNYTYNDINISGSYIDGAIDGHVITDTEDNKFDIMAKLDFNNRMDFDVKGVVDKLFLTPIFEVEQWENPYLTTRIDAKFEGTDIDDLAGMAVIDSTSLYDENFVFNPGPIYVQMSYNEDSELERKKTQVFSTLIEGEVVGDYHLETIGNDLMSLLSAHLPTLIKNPEWEGEEDHFSKFNFDFLLKNTEDASYALSLPFINVEPATIKGSIDLATDKTGVITAHVPRLMFGQNDIRETKFDISIGEQAGVGFTLDTYLAQDGGHVNAKLRTNAKNDSVTNHVSFNMQNSIADANGSLDIAVGFAKNMLDSLVTNISFNPTQIIFNDKAVDVMKSTVVYETDKIVVNNFELRQDGMLLIGVDGIASKKQEDFVRLFFNNTEMEAILAAFKIANFKGSINGGLIVNQALADPLIRTDNFRIENIHTQTDTLGTLLVNGDWDQTLDGLSLNAGLNNEGKNYLSINGFVPLGGDSPMDMDVSVSNMPLAWVQPFAVSALSKLSGTIDSKINLSGKLDAIETNGWVGVNEGVMTVAFTNVTYNISDTINISPQNIGLNNLVITDNNNNKAHLNLSLNHSNFDGMTYTVGLKLNDFLLLNNESQTDQMAYGTLKLSGDINIEGSASGVFGSANLRNDSRSKVMIEIPQTSQATEYSGIIYINTPQVVDSLSFLRDLDADGKINTRLKSEMPINIQAIINLNSMLEAGVIINPTTGDAFEINGNGQIRANFDTRSQPSVKLYGDYIAESGKFHYNFQGLKSIDFNIRSGSTVTLVGDPLSTQFNITAYNQVNADLTTLSEAFANEVTSTRIPVNATLDIQGNLDKMNLSYGVELPDASNDVRQRLNSILSTDEQKNKQFASLLLTGGFFAGDGGGDTGLGSNLATSLAAGQLSRGMDALLAGALNDNWSINTNLQSTDGTFDNMRMGVDVSTRLFDDKLRLTTNLSYGDNSTLASQQAFMGEFELEYDLNTWLMLRAYNRSNQRFSKRSPTTQGAGVVVTRNALRFRDLFKFSFRKKNNE